MLVNTSSFRFVSFEAVAAAVVVPSLNGLVVARLVGWAAMGGSPEKCCAGTTIE